MNTEECNSRDIDKHSEDFHENDISIEVSLPLYVKEEDSRKNSNDYYDAVICDKNCISKNNEDHYHYHIYFDNNINWQNNDQKLEEDDEVQEKESVKEDKSFSFMRNRKALIFTFLVVFAALSFVTFIVIISLIGNSGDSSSKSMDVAEDAALSYVPSSLPLKDPSLPFDNDDGSLEGGGNNVGLLSPSLMPTIPRFPSQLPSSKSAAPSNAPSIPLPSNLPSFDKDPSYTPSHEPTSSPTIHKSLSPTLNPTFGPSISELPSQGPSKIKSNIPTAASDAPTLSDTYKPSVASKNPSFQPSHLPTMQKKIRNFEYIDAASIKTTLESMALDHPNLVTVGTAQDWYDLQAAGNESDCPFDTDVIGCKNYIMIIEDSIGLGNSSSSVAEVFLSGTLWR